VEAVRDLLRRVAPFRQRAGHRLGGELVAEAGLVAVACEVGHGSSSALGPSPTCGERGWCEGAWAGREGSRAARGPSPGALRHLPPQGGKRAAAGLSGLQHAALDLVALDAFEQGLEVALAEAFVA